MMERLTKRIPVPKEERKVVVFTQGKYSDTIPAEMTHDDIRKVLRKLAEYEDAEEQALLLRLPIAEGTTVYIIDNNTDACTDDCKYFNVGYCCEDYCSMPNVDDDVYPQLSDIPVCEKQYLEVVEIKPSLDWIFHNRDNFGKTVFLTQSEAEQKLKEMEDK